MVGAPGSKWSSVATDIYYSPEIDQTDSSLEREYKSPNSTGPAYHVGAYWDPGMEFDIGREHWDTPFSGDGIKIIKSHTLSHHLPCLSESNFPIVMVYRNDVECFEHWKKAGGFDITYPNYKPYYKDLDTMYEHIVKQNSDIMTFIKENYNRVERVTSNLALCKNLGLSTNKSHKFYNERDVSVYVYR